MSTGIQEKGATYRLKTELDPKGAVFTSFLGANGGGPSLVITRRVADIARAAHGCIESGKGSIKVCSFLSYTPMDIQLTGVTTDAFQSSPFRLRLSDILEEDLSFSTESRNLKHHK
jgi:hypothetical protein